MRLINLANIGLFDAVFDLSSLFNRYPSYQQRPYYGGQGGFGQGGFYPGGYNSQGGFGSYPGTGSGSYPGTGSGLGTNILGKKNWPHRRIFFLTKWFFLNLFLGGGYGSSYGGSGGGFGSSAFGGYGGYGGFGGKDKTQVFYLVKMKVFGLLVGLLWIIFKIKSFMWLFFSPIIFLPIILLKSSF